MNETKTRILSVAEELFSKHGIAGTTITKIAQKAQVADSLAYQYFKGKEDIVFTILLERMKETHELLNEQLQGIRDTRSQLTKMIWYGLRYNDLHRDYVQNLMFECRSNMNFYKSEAYGLIKKHARIMLDILNQGAHEGAFRNDINMSFVRDIIYGTTDFEAISCAVTGEIDESSNDLDDILALLLPMIEIPVQSDTTDKREQILLSAEKIFSEKGFSKATIQNIAETASVAEGSIYDYFKNKEDLLFSISEARLTDHINRLSGTFHIKTPDHKLRVFIRNHFMLYMENQDYLKVFLLDTLLRKKFYTSKAYKTQRAYFQILEDIIEEGKKEGFFRADVNKRVFRNMFLGSFAHTALRWIISGNRNIDKLSEINQLVALFSDAVSVQPTA